MIRLELGVGIDHTREHIDEPREISAWYSKMQFVIREPRVDAVADASETCRTLVFVYRCRKHGAGGTLHGSNAAPDARCAGGFRKDHVLPPGLPDEHDVRLVGCRVEWRIDGVAERPVESWDIWHSSRQVVIDCDHHTHVCCSSSAFAGGKPDSRVQAPIVHFTWSRASVQKSSGRAPRLGLACASYSASCFPLRIPFVSDRKDGVSGRGHPLSGGLVDDVLLSWPRGAV